MSMKRNILGTIIEYHDESDEDLDEDLDVEAKKSMTELESNFYWIFLLARVRNKCLLAI